MQRIIGALIVSLAMISNLCDAQSGVKTPLPADHPLVGTWKLNVPTTNCYETYQVLADGTTHVTSGEEIAESEFEISLHPDSKGFYKWVDKIIKDNGKPDCTKGITPIGDVSVTFIKLNPSGSQFLLCEMEDIKACIGPFIRQEGI
jgi:hypothetical protein